MDFRILGPIEVAEGGRPVPLGAAKQRALLAVLLLHPNEVVSSDRLIDEIWRERVPAKAVKSIQVYVSQLRSSLGDDRLETRGPGYRLQVGPHELDAMRFERLLEEGREALVAGDAERAAGTLRAALGLWRGAALTDVAYEEFAQAEIARLEELRLVALEERIEADLALGRHVPLVAELEGLVRATPLRERPRAQLMLALYRSGRQAEALEAYQQARRVLVDELGLEPSRSLQELERAILTQDAALDLPVPGGTAVHRVRERSGVLIMAGAALLLAAAIAAAAVELLRGGPRAGLAAVAPDSVAVIDPKSNEIVRAISVGARPIGVAAGVDALWTANFTGRTLSRIDPRESLVVATLGTDATPTGLAAGAGSVWIADEFAGTVRRVDPATNTLVDTIHVGGMPVALAVGAGALWIVDAAGDAVIRFDATTGARRTIRVGDGPADVAVGADGVWVANAFDRTLTRLDSSTGAVVQRAIALRFAPSHLAAGAGGVWVTGTLADEVARVDPASNAVQATIPAGDGPTGVAIGRDAVWVADSSAGAVVRIDPRAGRVVKTIPIGASPDRLVVADGAVWVSVHAP
jgi:DNA-binding SARP family transcriptional activator/streptogramin lyase